MARITVLEAENFKRLRAVRIEPDGSVVVINGANRSGKSSTLDAIWAALGGKDASPEVPIREGARRAVARVTLDSGLVVERTWSVSGASKLTITGVDGERMRSPQTVLNELCSKHTVDPLAFASMDPRKQAATLKQIVGLDFSELDAKRQKLYDQRTEANRDAKRLEAQLPEHDASAPEKEVAVDGIMAEYQRANEEHQAFEARRKTLSETEEGNDRLRERIQKVRAELERLECSLADRESWIADERRDIETIALPSLDFISEKMSHVQEINEAVRSNARRAELVKKLTAALRESDMLTGAIEAIDDEKAKMLEQARFPIHGLGFDDAGVTYQGLPFSQASHAERLRVSTAIGLALNPELRVLLIRDAEKLDADGMRLIAELAEEHKAQLWLERAGHADPGAVVIEDGEVAGT
jgi:DNA repair exonuclease SbcCD ATPase subunit